MNTSYSDSDEATGKWLWKRRCDLVYHIRLSILYHRKRERFLKLLDNIGKFVSLIAISSIFVGVAGGNKWLAGISAVITVLAFVCDLASGARTHGELASAYGQLMYRIVREGETQFTNGMLTEWEAERAHLQAKEPPVLRGLAQLCQDEIAFANNEDPKSRDLSLWRKAAAQIGFGERPYKETASAPS